MAGPAAEDAVHECAPRSPAGLAGRQEEAVLDRVRLRVLLEQLAEREGRDAGDTGAVDHEPPWLCHLFLQPGALGRRQIIEMEQRAALVQYDALGDETRMA